MWETNSSACAVTDDGSQLIPFNHFLNVCRGKWTWQGTWQITWAFWYLYIVIFFISSPKEMFFDFREEGKRMLREKYQSVASHMCPDWGSNSQAKYVPWVGIKLTTLVYGMLLQPAELRGRGEYFYVFRNKNHSFCKNPKFRSKLSLSHTVTASRSVCTHEATPVPKGKEAVGLQHYCDGLSPSAPFVFFFCRKQSFFLPY